MCGISGRAHPKLKKIKKCLDKAFTNFYHIMPNMFMGDLVAITKKTIVEKVDMSPRLIQFYNEEGVVVPIGGGGRRGKSWQYSEKNLVEFGIIKQLAQYGITVSRIRQIISKINRSEFFNIFFSTTGDRVKPDLNIEFHNIYLIIYDMQDVFLSFNEVLALINTAGPGEMFSMAGHKNALILDITAEMID